MKRITFVLLYALLAVTVSAQTLYVRTQDKDGNVSPSEALSGPVGAYRFTIYPTDGGEAVDLTAMTVRFIVTDMGDGKVVVSNAPALVGTNYGFRGEGTLSRAVSTNTVQMMAYPEGTDPYALYWALLTVTSTPSAAVQVSVTSTSVVDLGNITVQWEIQGDGDMAPDSTDRNIVPHTDLGASLGRTNERYDEAHVRVGHFDSLIAGTVSVENAIGFLDNTKVKLSGETNAVILTNTSVQARSPTNDNEVATMGYVNAVAGGEINVGTVQIYTNSARVYVVTNPALYAETFRENAIPTYTPLIHRTYDEQDTWSNLNVTGSAWQFFVTNGQAHVIAPPESSSGRFFDYHVVTSGAWVRASVKIVCPLYFSVWANCNYGYGIAWQDYGNTNSVFHGRRANSLGDVLESYLFNLSFSESQDTRYVLPYQAGAVATAYTYLWGYNNITWYVDHDGTNKARYYLSTDANPYPQLQWRITNANAIKGFSVFAQSASAAAGATNSGAMIWDDFIIEEGALWSAPW